MDNRKRTFVLVVLLGLAAAASLVLHERRKGSRAAGSIAGSDPRAADVARVFLELEAAEAAAIARDIPAEQAASQAIEAISDWWDGLNRAPDALTHAAALPVGSVRVLAAGTPALPPHPLFTDFGAAVPGLAWTVQEWAQQLTAWRETGWHVARTRWHLLDHAPASAVSIVTFEVLAQHAGTGNRVQLRGQARIAGNGGLPGPTAQIEVTGLQALRAGADSRFRHSDRIPVSVPPHTPFVDPLISVPQPSGRFDDLLLVGAGLWCRFEPGGDARTEPLTGLPPERTWAAAVADWDRDGQPDLILGGSDGLRWLKGPDWHGPGEMLWKAASKVRHPQALAISDWDNDGDLDAFLGQYKLPYQGGQFPTPYYDANDGFDSYLLRNDGASGLRDVSNEAGLAAKRRRRIYSASFADWDDDGRPDLILVSDFAGVDLFRNRGDGSFEDVTAGLGDSRHLFGMAHATGDFDNDGRTDLFAIGMDSAVARRLDRGRLHRMGFEVDLVKRPAMTFGNRMFLGSPKGLIQAPWAPEVALGGWAWAVTPLDLDNDGHLDFHLCNGHETRESVRDYDRQFWLHDIHVAGSTNNPVTDIYFRNAAGRRAAERASYGGWQHGAFFVRCGPGRYADIGWLLGTSIPADTRNAVAFSRQGDGNLSLAVTTMDEWPAPSQVVHVLENTLLPGSPKAAWVGFVAADRAGIDVRVRVTAGGVTRERRFMSGESYRSQAAGRVHFGLGEAKAIDSIEIRRGNQPWQQISGVRINDWNTLPR